MADTLAIINATSIQFALNTPLFTAAQAAAQSIPDSAFTALTWPTPTVDTYTGWVVGTPTRYTGKVPGYYLVTASVGIAANATGARAIEIRKNGATNTANQTAVPSAGATFNTVIQVVSTVLLNGTTDYVEAYVDQNSGGARNTVTVYTSFNVQWVHA